MLVHWKGEPASSASWEDVESFVARYPHFQLEDELLVEGGRDVMWGRVYRCRSNAQGVQGATDTVGLGAHSAAPAVADPGPGDPGHLPGLRCTRCKVKLFIMVATMFYSG